MKGERLHTKIKSLTRRASSPTIKLHRKRQRKITPAKSTMYISVISQNTSKFSIRKLLNTYLHYKIIFIYNNTIT